MRLSRNTRPLALSVSGDGVQMMDILEISGWSGPFGPALRQDPASRLESGSVLLLPALGFALDEAEQQVMRLAGRSGGRPKNISLDPATGRCTCASLSGPVLAVLARAMERYAEAATGLVLGLMPGYRDGLTRGRTSFRPIEIATRNTSWRQDDKRVHVDAFPTRPQRGRRILRVFANVDPTGRPRVWRLGPKFECFAATFLPGLKRSVPGQAWLLHRLGLTQGRRSSYDEIMLYLHDAAKRDSAWQQQVGFEEIAFEAGSVWLAYTDQVPHAALSGCNALEQTFYVALEVLVRPETAPITVLERLCGRSLR